MKKLFTTIAILFSLSAFAQKLTFNDIVGTYTVSKMYLNDTLFYDKSNPAKSNVNVLIDVGKQVAIYSDREDSTLAIALFYKDIRKALSTAIVFNSDSTTWATCNSKEDFFTHLNYKEHWVFDEKKQRVKILRNGNVTEQMPAKRVNGKVILYIEDKKEKTKLELERMY